MRKQVILQLRDELQQVLGNKIMLAEPDWQMHVDYPAVYMEASDERVIRAINTQRAREMYVDVYIVDRCLQNDVDSHYLATLDMLDAIDEFVINHRAMDNYVMYVERTRVQAVKRVVDNYALIGAGIRIKIVFVEV